jgi:hypothetical protein
MSDKTIYLPIVFHFHQPVDNYVSVIEDIYKKSYEPLINQLFQFPEIKFTLHFSGNLLEWFLSDKPEFIAKIKKMAKRGQIEIIGGGYYEPVFAIIPYRDKMAQIKKLSELIKKEFGLNVKGAWLSERVWEPDYPSFLSNAGLTYVIVDDNHFRSTGIAEEDTLYSYITEDEGKTLRIFPINQELRYLTPWKPTYQSIDYLEKVADKNGDRFALFISDAEKMGVWGTTHEICYVDGHGHQEGDNGKPFIPAFLDQIKNNKWIKPITISEYMEKHPAKGLIYLPTASYDKMEEWVLPTKFRKDYTRIRKWIWDDENLREIFQFLRGGFWRYFLIKYPESNNMHKKMLYVREKLIHIEDDLRKIENDELIPEILKKINRAWDEIYKAQCNDCYWHGLFGGIYLQFLRFSVYTHLINAEKIMDEINNMINRSLEENMSIIPIDFDKNSKCDYLIESNLLNLYINPSDGGTIFELDYKPNSYNILNTLTRWEEAYHGTAKFENREFIIDRFRRSMLRIRFFHKDVSLKELQSDTYFEFNDFIDGNFKVTSSEKDGKIAIIEMEQLGSIKDTKSDERAQCLITKDVYVEENEIRIILRINFEEIQKKRSIINNIIKNLKLGIDIPFYFNGEPDSFNWESKEFVFNDNKRNHLLDPLLFQGTTFKAYDRSYNLNFEVKIKNKSNKTKIAKFPLIAYTFTEEEYREIYQGVNILPIFKLDKHLEITLQLKIF